MGNGAGMTSLPGCGLEEAAAPGPGPNGIHADEMQLNLEAYIYILMEPSYIIINIIMA